MATEQSLRRLIFRKVLPPLFLLCLLVFIGTVLVNDNQYKKSVWITKVPRNVIPSNAKEDSSKVPRNATPSYAKEDISDVHLAKKDASDVHVSTSESCKSERKPIGAEKLPKGIIQATSNLDMEPLSGSPQDKGKELQARSLLAIPVGIKQIEIVNQIVSKFLASNFTVILFHYDGVVDKWRELTWAESVVHISVINQTKWWFAKRFLHPDLVNEYDYVFLWDEDLGVENFNPSRYLNIIKREGLEISQPALDRKSTVHHRITARWRRGDVHRRVYKLNGSGTCFQNSTMPPCTGWVEMMAPVFSKAAWRCVWHMIQNDLIYAWGLDYKLGYCAQGDRSLNVGVVDSEYVFHKGIATLGGINDSKTPPGSTSRDSDRFTVRLRSYTELKIFERRWNEATKNDLCWIDPYPEQA